MTNNTQTDRRALRDERRSRTPAPITPQIPKIPEIDWEKLREMPVLSDKHVPEQAIATLAANGRSFDQAKVFVEANGDMIKAKFLELGQAAHEAAGHQGNIAAENTRTTHELREWLLAEFDNAQLG